MSSENRPSMTGLPAAGIESQPIRTRYPADEQWRPALPSQPITGDVEHAQRIGRQLIAEDPTRQPKPRRHWLGDTLAVLSTLVLVIEISLCLAAMYR